MKTFSRTIFWIAIGAVSVLSLLPSDQLPPAILDRWDKAQHALAFLVVGASGFGRTLRVLFAWP
jgi:hypothetical protein